MGPAFVPQLGPQFRSELGSELGPKLGSDWGQTLSKMVIWDAIGFDFYPRIDREEAYESGEKRENGERKGSKGERIVIENRRNILVEKMHSRDGFCDKRGINSVF